MVKMATTKTAIKALKPGRYCIIEGEPCKVLSVTTSVSGKHGAAKARLDAIGLFDNKKRSIVKPADAPIDVPIIEKKSAQVVALMGETAQLMDMETYETFESPIPEELKSHITQGAEVLYWDVMGKRILVQIKSK